MNLAIEFEKMGFKGVIVKSRRANKIKVPSELYPPMPNIEDPHNPILLYRSDITC